MQILQSYAFKTDYGAVYVGLSVRVLLLFIAYFLLSGYLVAGAALGGAEMMNLLFSGCSFDKSFIAPALKKHLYRAQKVSVVGFSFWNKIGAYFPY